MIILIGTKGQLIKMVGVMQELDKRHINYKYIQTDQHPKMNCQIEESFNLKYPNLFLGNSLNELILHNRQKDLVSFKDIVRWLFICFYNTWHYRKFFEDENILITQGDTISTLFACFVAKIFKLKLAHIEAGLRSYSLLHPFPEEIIRRIVSRFADYLFVPEEWAIKNLSHVKGKVIYTKQNTVYDALCQFKKRKSHDQYIVAAIHRQETIYNGIRLMKAVETIHKCSDIARVKYILHPASEKKLKEYNFYNGLCINANIELFHYQNYPEFMKMVSGALFVVSDGGGLQEETYYLDVPCMVMRMRTERKIGLNETAYLTYFNDKRIDYFLKNYGKFRRQKKFKRYYPSRIIVDFLQEELVWRS